MLEKFSKIIYFDTLESSNDYLINLYKKYQINTELVVVANNQTKGRGRMGKRWFSDSESLTFSCSASELYSKLLFMVLIKFFNSNTSV